MGYYYTACGMLVGLLLATGPSAVFATRELAQHDSQQPSEPGSYSAPAPHNGSRHGHAPHPPHPPRSDVSVNVPGAMHMTGTNESGLDLGVGPLGRLVRVHEHPTRQC